jgi:hypothetical protein
LFGLALLGSLNVSCAGFWQIIGRQQRAASWHHAIELARSGHCDEALLSIERAQNDKSLTRRFEAESTRLRADCLDQVGRRSEALAHYRFIRDFLPESPAAASLPPHIREETRERSLAAIDGRPYEGKPLTPRYSRAARLAGIAGDLQVSYVVDSSGRAEEIRVVNESHPLLASWAIEAVANATFEVPDGRALEVGNEVLFRFMTRNGVSESRNSSERSESSASTALP